MKFYEVLKHVDKSIYNTANPDCTKFCEAVGVNDYIDYQEFDKHVKCYWIRSHFCTDQKVGECAVYLKNVLVGYTSQQHRKSDYVIYFIDEASALWMQQFLLSLVHTESCQFNILTDEAIDEETDMYYTCDYGDELFVDSVGLYTDAFGVVQKVAVSSRTGLFADNISMVRVRPVEGGEEFMIPAKEFMIPIKVKCDDV